MSPAYLKPKTPCNLRDRLGPVVELLDVAEATGRCQVLWDGIMQSPHPPALAALAADVFVHEHLFAATAALESALAGTPTVVMDWDGWTSSSLYQLGVGRVVFTDWDSMWDALCSHWSIDGGVPGFGDWTPMLEQLDPFRDGRAAERMGNYLMWLLEGIRAGTGRELAMADAADRYSQAWGHDKVASVNSRILRRDLIHNAR